MVIFALITLILLFVILFTPITIRLQLVNTIAIAKVRWAGLTITSFSTDKSKSEKRVIEKKKKVKQTSSPKKHKVKKKNSIHITIETLINLLPEIIVIITYILTRLRKLFGVPSYRKINWKWIIGGDDPARIGFLFGLYQSVRQLLPDGVVEMDFVNQENHFECSFRMEIRVVHLIFWLLISIATFPIVKVWKVYRMVKSS